MWEINRQLNYGASIAFAVVLEWFTKLPQPKLELQSHDAAQAFRSFT